MARSGHGGFWNRRQVQAALDRGQEQGLGWCAVYQPGEEVRCPGLPGEKDLCGGYLYTESPDSTAFVRMYEERRFNERRRTPRGNYRCPRHDHHRLEVEHHVLGAAA